MYNFGEALMKDQIFIDKNGHLHRLVYVSPTHVELECLNTTGIKSTVLPKSSAERQLKPVSLHDMVPIMDGWRLRMKIADRYFN